MNLLEGLDVYFFWGMMEACITVCHQSSLEANASMFCCQIHVGQQVREFAHVGNCSLVLVVLFNVMFLHL